ncbi:MAG: DUF47 family protein [Actinomycetota bacterium]|nr:DUF47 family protein [Actinomycetota bacterium]
MRLRLTPQSTTFYDYFSANADNIVEGARLLGELFDSPGDTAAVAAKVRDIEHAGDEVTHQVLRQLNSTFVTPFDREDIYQLASNLDDVLDLMEAAADLVVLYGLTELPKETLKLVDVLQRAAAVTAAAMPRLRTLKNLEEYWIEVNELENEADSIYRRLVARLFSGEYDALTVMKLKEVIDQLEGAADAFEHVAHAVETIAVKES